MHGCSSRKQNCDSTRTKVIKCLSAAKNTCKVSVRQKQQSSKCELTNTASTRTECSAGMKFAVNVCFGLAYWPSFSSKVYLLTKSAAFINVNVPISVFIHKYCMSQHRNRAPDAACGHPPPTPRLPGKCNSNWLSGGGGLRLQPYSKKAGQGCLKRGAQVQIVFYKSPLRGICVYPWPLICCWGSLGKR